jgi:hypothetical protein
MPQPALTGGTESIAGDPMDYPIRVGLVAGALCLSSLAQATDQPEIKALKQELEQMQHNYQTQLQSLQKRISELEQHQQTQESAPVEVAAPAAPAEAANRFNPAISVILDGTAARFSRSPDKYKIPGFPLDSEAGPGEQGLSIAESELVFSANVDDKFYGRLTASLSPNNELSIEEAFMQTLAMPAGLTLQAGRFYSDIGYLNSKHVHTWDFVDAPLAYRAMFGDQYDDDGVQLRWLAPMDQYLEFGAEVFRGDSFPAAGAAKRGTGTRTVFVHTGGDVGASNSWLAGLSWLGSDAVDRDVPTGVLFNGTSNMAIADFVWKWAPNGNPYRNNLTLQAEYLHSTEKGDYTINGATNPYDASQSGWYAQAVYQFMPRWRTGLRYDRLQADDPGAAFSGTELDPAGHTPQRTSLMVDFSNSEFSRIRLQYNRDQSSPQVDNEWYLQYIMSLGSHGAHRY